MTIGSGFIDLTGSEIARLISKKLLSPVEVTQAYLERINRLDPTLNAFITVCGEEAVSASKKAERAVLRGEPLGILHGVPIGVKDQFDSQGVVTTIGSLSLANNIPTNDAAVLARMRNAGAILLGKTSMTQFASGLGDHWQFGKSPRNPWNIEYETIGSSNGSAIAVAASMSAMALGEDTGGSIRCPASATSVVGLRPTWGRVSRQGMHGLSWSMDAAGPITRSVEDAAIMMNVISGYHADDPNISKRPVPDYTRNLNGNIKGLRIGILNEYMDSRYTDHTIIQSVNEACLVLEGLGAYMDRVSLPLLADVRHLASSIIANDAAYQHRLGICESPREYGANLLIRLVVGALIPSQILQKAYRARALIRREFHRLFRKFDLLVSPTLMFTLRKDKYAERITVRAQAEGKFGQGTGDATILAPFFGVPAMTVPCGFDSNRLPIGLQIMGSYFQEETVLRAGHAYEQHTWWHKERPDL